MCLLIESWRFMRVERKCMSCLTLASWDEGGIRERELQNMPNRIRRKRFLGDSVHVCSMFNRCQEVQRNLHY